MQIVYDVDNPYVYFRRTPEKACTLQGFVAIRAQDPDLGPTCVERTGTVIYLVSHHLLTSSVIMCGHDGYNLICPMI